MQINEITKPQLNEAIPGLSNAIYSGLSRLFGRTPNAQAIAKQNEKKIGDVASKALPMWDAKAAQLKSALGVNTNLDDELEAWVEENILRGNLRMDQLDPVYKQNIQQLIKSINTGQNPGVRAQEFAKLITVSMMARPSRAQASTVAASSSAANVVQVARRILQATKLGQPLSDEQIRAFAANAPARIPAAIVSRLAGDDAAEVVQVLNKMGVEVI